MTTMTILEYSLVQFAAKLQEAVQQGWVMDSEGANFWGRYYEVIMQKDVHEPESVFLEVVAKKTMGRPARAKQV